MFKTRAFLVPVKVNGDRHDSPREVANIIRKGDADIGLAFSLTPSEDIRVLFSQPSPVLAIMHPDHPLAGQKKVSLSQLTAYPLALPYPDTTVRQLFDYLYQPAATELSDGFCQ